MIAPYIKIQKNPRFAEQTSILEIILRLCCAQAGTWPD
jgi:hypothetical protein